VSNREGLLQRRPELGVFVGKLDLDGSAFMSRFLQKTGFMLEGVTDNVERPVIGQLGDQLACLNRLAQFDRERLNFVRDVVIW